ncbi:MAG TPA: polysaccharide deacetylase family protein [Anaerolineales bacterium]|nr:polysaccharide deacetylase family protein [Anaerolineales bacterium]
MNRPFNLTVMMYHYIRDRGDAAEAGLGIPGMPVRDFEAQLDELSKHYTCVNWPEVRMALQESKPLPNSACLLTFDDGVCDHSINVFKILHERGLSGLFFIMDRREKAGLVLAHKIHFLLAKLSIAGLRDAIWEKLDAYERARFMQAEERYRMKYPPTSVDGRIDLLKAVLQRELSVWTDSLLGELFEEHIGSEKEIARQYYLNLEQIEEMARGGMHFGGHSQNHPWFDWIDQETREREIQASSEFLRQSEPGPWAFAYPYGGLFEDSPTLLKKHNFAAAFTTHPQTQHSDPYFIGRLDGEEIAQIGNKYA